MKTSELHTFKSILTEGIKIKDSETGTVTCSPIACIYIPKIQRAYAQGRISEEDVRKDFLDALFDTLLSEEAKPLELSFLFGSKQAVIRRKSEKDQSSSGLELLDGQQRTTTLFLLHWYIGIKENGLVPDFLNKFTYETRDTSIDFLSKITSTDSNKKEEGEVSEVNSKGNKDHNWITDISAKGEKPSKAIKNNKWFTDDFYCDPTVCAMLTMLDEIDKQYAQRKCSHLWDKLDRLQFYVLMLEEFDMNDELYIKMNSRGLSLIPFENFKASLVKYMKAKERNGLYGTDKTENGQAPFWFDFVSKMDAEWIDIFWKFTPAEGKGNDICKENIPTDDFNTGVRYLSFINNYLFTKAAISEGIVNNEEGELTNFFREVNAAKRLTGWDKYERVFGIMEDREADDSAQSNSPEVSYTVLYKLDKVLTAFQKHGKYIVDQIKADPYGRTDKFDLDNIKFNNYHERVAFGAVTEFIENIPEH